MVLESLRGSEAHPAPNASASPLMPQIVFTGAHFAPFPVWGIDASECVMQRSD